MPMLKKVRKDNDGKSIIVAYSKNRMNEKEILRSMKKLESECGCNVRHLSHVGAFILTYRRGMTVAATQLQLDSSVKLSYIPMTDQSYHIQSPI